MSVPYAHTVDLASPWNEGVDRVIAALAAQGFGILTRIDTHEVLEKKLGIQRAPYVILGACNPTLAARALEIEPGIGVFMPCSVVIEGVGSGSRVWFGRADTLLATTVHPGMRAIAAEVDQRLAAARAALA